MPTLAVGNRKLIQPGRGFTLLELLVVLAIVAFASAGVGFAMRGGVQTQLEREALRLAALLESGRVRSQVSGVPVRWRVSDEGFRFEGLPKTDLPEQDLPQNWLDSDTSASVDIVTPPIERRIDQTATPKQSALLLGPDPIIEPQTVILFSRSQPLQRVRLSTDGVRPFALQSEAK